MNIAVVIAGGIGSRVGQEIPKQFLEINGVPLIIYTLNVFQNNNNIHKIIVVTLPAWKSTLTNYCHQYGISKLDTIVDAGKVRFESIYNGVKYIKNFAKDDDLVVLHDANRPLLSNAVLDNSLTTAQKYGSALSILPCYDAMFISHDGCIADEDVDKKILFQGQTPETFHFSIINEVCRKNFEEGKVDLSISALLLKDGKKVYLSKGSNQNFKITTQEDLDLFKALLNISPSRKLSQKNKSI